jgi:hypothetical protein
MICKNIAVYYWNTVKFQSARGRGAMGFLLQYRKSDIEVYFYFDIFSITPIVYNPVFTSLKFYGTFGVRTITSTLLPK